MLIRLTRMHSHVCMTHGAIDVHTWLGAGLPHAYWCRPWHKAPVYAGPREPSHVHVRFRWTVEVHLRRLNMTADALSHAAIPLGGVLVTGIMKLGTKPSTAGHQRLYEALCFVVRGVLDIIRP